ncbi:MAG: hypothetical protein ACFFD2_07375 [Promethearchaeota archaeon]
MGTVKVIGEYLALVSGAMVLINCLIVADSLFRFYGNLSLSRIWLFNWIINLLLATIVLICSKIEFTVKKARGALIVNIGLCWIIFAILNTASMAFLIIFPYSLFNYYLFSIPYITIEGLLCHIGGILILASSE